MAAIWGIYANAADAAACVGSFADSVLDPSIGIAWLNNGLLYALRPPRYDGNGNGLILTLQHDTTAAVRKAIVTPGLGQCLRDWFIKQMTVLGQAEIQQAQMNLAAGKAVDDFVTTAYHRAVGKDRADTAGMAVDIVCVALSVVLIATGGAEVLGVVALAGGVAMLLMDGTAYVQELAGDDEMAEQTRDATFDYRLLAMVAALPDAAWNVGKVLVEGSKMASEAARIETIVSRAAGDAARSSAAAGRATEVLERTGPLIGLDAMRRSERRPDCVPPRHACGYGCI